MLQMQPTKESDVFIVRNIMYILIRTKLYATKKSFHKYLATVYHVYTNYIFWNYSNGAGLQI